MPRLLKTNPLCVALFSGRVFGLVFSVGSAGRLVAKRAFVLAGTVPHSEMGDSLAVGFPYADMKTTAFLAVGSPVEDIQGQEVSHLNAGVCVSPFRIVALG